MSYETLQFATEAGVARITLDRPEAANGMNLKMTDELLDVALRCDADPSVRAILLTGAGRMFCAGGDLKSFANEGERIGAALKELTVRLHGAISRLVRGDAPVIAAVNGAAAGAGMSLAAACDLVLAGESAKFTMAYTAAGLSPDGSSTWFLPRLIGMRKTQELMLTNRRLSAAEALEWGLVTQVVADDALLEQAGKLASRLAAGPTRSFGIVKKLLVTSLQEGLETQMDAEAVGISAASLTPDGQEGISAFLEKREPKFSGA